MANNGQSVSDGKGQLGLKSKTPAPTPDGVNGTPRTYTQAEFSAQQSTYEGKLKEARTELATTKTTLEGLQREHAKTKATLEVLQEEANSPYADDEKKTAAEKIRNREIALKAERAEFAVIQEQFQGTLEEAKQTKVGKWAQEVSEWTLGKVEVKDLIQYGTKAEMLEHVQKNLDIKTLAGEQKETPDPNPRVQGVNNPHEGDKTAAQKVAAGLEKLRNKE